MTVAFAQVVTVIRAGETDRWGDPLEGPAGEPRRHQVKGCVFVPGSSTESGTWANSVAAEATLLAPFGADLTASDRVEVAGIAGVWNVEGEPARWRSPLTGRRFGTSAVLRRVEG